MAKDHTDDQSRCMELAAPMLLELHGCWHVAFGRYHQYDSAFTAEHDDTTTANCIRSHMLTEVVGKFDGCSGFTLMRLRGLCLLNYRDMLVWRFKKVDGDGRHQNYQTQQQKDFDDQLVLPGIPPSAIRLTSGYQPDPAAQSIERIIVSRLHKRSIMWASQVNVIDGVASWEDITPLRLPGTSCFDYRGRKGGKT